MTTASTKTGSTTHPSDTDEAAFEAHIAGWLVEHGGYRRVKLGNAGGESDFDGVAGLDTADLFEFIGTTQAKQWKHLVDSGYGGDETLARAGFVQRLASQLDKHGTVKVLRQGVVDYNVTVRLRFLQAGAWVDPGVGRALRGERVVADPPTSLRATEQQDDRSGLVRERHPGGDGRVEEPADRPGCRARHPPVPQGPGIRRTAR